jgi:L-threonylcarbamoyladenylate synthase
VSLRTTTDVDQAVAVLRSEGLVALPTETVYGLAGDASSADAVHRIFAVKGRPATHPVIVHLPSAQALDAWAHDVPAWAGSLVEQLWPGPLTLVVPRSGRVSDAVTGGQATVGLRVPAHPLTLDVLERFDGGLAAPSANRYGQVSPTSATHVVAELEPFLDAERDVVLDGGPCRVGVESTIVGAWDAVPRLLRPGAVTTDQIRDITGLDVVTADDGVRTPGSTPSHYAPRARVVVVEPDAVDDLTTLAGRFDRAAVLALTEVDVPASLPRLADPTDADEYARLLYGALRDADDAGIDVVIAVAPAPKGVGAAVADRLRRAARAGDPT